MHTKRLILHRATDKQAIETTVIVTILLISEFDLKINYTIGKPSSNFADPHTFCLQYGFIKLSINTNEFYICILGWKTS